MRVSKPMESQYDYLMPRTLLVTNDYPPRRGGIEGFAKALADRLAGPDGGGIVVYTATMGPNDDEIDGLVNYPVIRDRTRTLLPTPRVRREAIRLFKEYNCDTVLIGSSVPLGVLAKPMRAAGAKRIVAITHGHEVWYARLPLGELLLRYVAANVDNLTAISKWTRRAIGKALPYESKLKQELLSPGADPQVFYPGCGGAAIRAKFGLSPDTPVVVCAARAIACKGQDQLIAAWPLVLESVPDAVLIIVGGGNYLPELVALANTAGLRNPAPEITDNPMGNTAGDKVIFTGSVPWNDVAAYMDAANVVATPCRSRLFGLGPEGYGLVFMEAAACGKPVIVGRSGGAPEATLDGVSGFVVNPIDTGEIAGRIVELLTDPEKARTMGQKGLEWVLANHTWNQVANRCSELLGR